MNNIEAKAKYYFYFLVFILILSILPVYMINKSKEKTFIKLENTVNEYYPEIREINRDSIFIVCMYVGIASLAVLLSGMLLFFVLPKKSAKHKPKNGPTVLEKDLITEKDRQIETHLLTIEKLNSKIQSADEEMIEFIRVVSHDLKSPLTTIEMFAEVLDRDIDLNIKRAKEELQRIRLSTRRLRKLIDSLTELTLVNVQKTQKSMVAVADILEEYLKPYEPEKSQKSSGTSEYMVYLLPKDKSLVFLNNGLKLIYADSTKMYQVFSNLLKNSLTYKSMEPAQIYIDGFFEGSQTHIVITDNGMGINYQFIEKIFEVCFRLVSHDKYEGTGVGLAIVKKIINQHNGKIWMESEGEGKGSKCHIILPNQDKV